MEIFRTETFKRAIKRLKAAEADLAALERMIADDPTAGDVIIGTGGARKIRFSMGGKGKRGGGRAIYVAIVTKDRAYLITAYSKADQTDISEETRKAIRAFVKDLKGA